MQRSRLLLRNSMLALLEEKSFDHITVREITGRAKLGYATFFRHYASKDALLHDLAAGEITELLAISIPVLSASDSGEMCRAICAYVYEKRGLWRALLTGGAAGMVRSEFIRLGRPYATPSYGRWLPLDLAVTWTTGGLLTVLAWWLGQDRIEQYSIETVADIIDRLAVASTMHPPQIAGVPASPEFDPTPRRRP